MCVGLASVDWVPSPNSQSKPGGGNELLELAKLKCSVSGANRVSGPATGAHKAAGDGRGATETRREAVPVQPPLLTVYVRVRGAGKLAGGVNTNPVAWLPLTPGPLNTPPAGLPRSAKGWVLPEHITVSAARATTIRGVIVTDCVACTTQLLTLRVYVS